MLIRQIALVSEIREMASDLNIVAAALQKQASRDFGPIWDVAATVDGFSRLEDVPLGYWPILILENAKATSGAEGIHLDPHNQPMALVQYDEGWTLTTSHECLEMLADPFGNRLQAGAGVQGDGSRVEYLVEVCDPCEDDSFAYSVNGVTVSDFCTPCYFDAVGVPGIRYSFCGHIAEPRQVLKGGYLSWHNPGSDEWMQLQYFDSEPCVKTLGKMTQQGRSSLREAIDANTRHQYWRTTSNSKRPLLSTASLEHRKSMRARATNWRAHIEDLLSGRNDHRSFFEKPEVSVPS
jgi:hypothetical protein